MMNQFLSAPFRPFFLGAALVAVIWMSLWLGFLHAGVPGYETIPSLYWHAHEMLFGFAMAVVAGFLLTAMQNWTGLRLVTPIQLGLLAGVWLAGRLAFALTDLFPLWLVSVVDLAFLPLLWLVVARTLLAAGNRRNYAFLVLLPLLWFLDLLMHLEYHGLVTGMIMRAVDTTVFLLATLLVFMGGRVIPFFTANRLPAVAPRQWPWLSWSSTLSMLAVALIYPVTGRHAALAPLLVLAALLTAVRLLAWKPWRTAGEPMLWILHLGYAWLPIGLLLLAAHLLGSGVSWSIGIHALMAGAMGALILGMMARVALGHTGRPIAAPRPMVVAFVLVTLAAITRIAAGTMPDAAWPMLVAGLFWALAYLLYLIVYTPIMLRSRM